MNSVLISFSPLLEIKGKIDPGVELPMSIHSRGKLKSASTTNTFFPCPAISKARLAVKKVRSFTFLLLVMQITRAGVAGSFVSPPRWVFWKEGQPSRIRRKGRSEKNPLTLYPISFLASLWNLTYMPG